MSQPENLGEHYLQNAAKNFRMYRELAEKAAAQLADDQIFWTPDAEANSIAVIMKHLAGNMLSRWTDLFTTDGEKPWRNRDTDFVDEFSSRDEVLAYWEKGWSKLFESLRSLTPTDLQKTVLIRNEPHTIVEALNRQLTHYAYHAGQIVFIAKHLKSADWQSLSIPRGKSADFVP